MRDVSLWGITPTCHCTHNATGRVVVSAASPVVTPPSSLDLSASSTTIFSPIVHPPLFPNQQRNAVVPYDEIVASCLRCGFLPRPTPLRVRGTPGACQLGRRRQWFSPFLLLAPRRLPSLSLDKKKHLNQWEM